MKCILKNTSLLCFFSIVNSDDKYCVNTKKGQSFPVENEQFNPKKPNKIVTDSSKSTLRYTFPSHTNLSINRTQEKYPFSNPSSLGP